MTLRLKLKDSFVANSSYGSSFLELLQKVALREGEGGAVGTRVFLSGFGAHCWLLCESH